MSVFTVLGVIGNFTSVVVFSRNSSLHKRTSYLLRGLAISNGLMAVVAGTMYTTSCFHHTWVFSDIGKNYSGFIGTFLDIAAFLRVFHEELNDWDNTTCWEQFALILRELDICIGSLTS